MNLKIAVQIDKDLNVNTDSSLYLTKEALNRNHKVFFYNTENLYSLCGKIYAVSNVVKMSNTDIILKEEVTIDLDEIDIVLMRQNPPFNMRYITTTYLLEKCNSLIINNPRAVRNFPEKIFNYSDFMLPTLITENLEVIRKFYLEHKDVVLKPLYSFGGNDVVHTKSLENTETVAKMMMKLYKEPILIQKFLPDVVEYGDKRVLLLDGAILGFYARLNKTGFRMNSVLGASAVKTDLSPLEIQICELIGADLVRNGILFAGIDIMGGKYICEINVTSPTGLSHINRIFNRNMAVDCLDCFESKL